jgi:hypothetical protein
MNLTSSSMTGEAGVHLPLRLARGLELALPFSLEGARPVGHCGGLESRCRVPSGLTSEEQARVKSYWARTPGTTVCVDPGGRAVGRPPCNRPGLGLSSPEGTTDADVSPQQREPEKKPDLTCPGRVGVVKQKVNGGIQRPTGRTSLCHGAGPGHLFRD